jgi:hypothetical protein
VGQYEKEIDRFNYHFKEELDNEEESIVIIPILI